MHNIGLEDIGQTMEITEELRNDVKIAITEAGALGPIGAFSTAIDVASIATIWGYLLFQYISHYGYNLKKEDTVKICSTALLGLGGYYSGCKMATRLFHLIPGAGTLLAMGISSFANVIFTYRFALTLTRIFQEPQVNLKNLAKSIIIMFAGTLNGVKNVVDIVALFREK